MTRLNENCPCCGKPVDIGAELQWNAEARSLIRDGLSLRMSPVRGKIFDMLWRNRGKRIIPCQEMMERVYADDPNGGPDSDHIVSVQMNHLKKSLVPFGLTITTYRGYSLIDLPAKAVSAA